MDPTRACPRRTIVEVNAAAVLADQLNQARNSLPSNHTIHLMNWVKRWHVSANLIRRLCEEEGDVLVIDRPEELHKRQYRTVRIPRLNGRQDIRTALHAPGGLTTNRNLNTYGAVPFQKGAARFI